MFFEEENMEKYCFNKIDTQEYFALLSLLDYRQSISEYLKEIRLKNAAGKRVLIDTALVSGINEYRFIVLRTDNQGVLDLNSIRYVEPNDEVVKKSNKVLSDFKEYVQHSALSSKQVNLILSI